MQMNVGVQGAQKEPKSEMERNHWPGQESVGVNEAELSQTSTLATMGKAQKKTGKGRIDKFYKLAKYALLSFILLSFPLLTKNSCRSTENRAIERVQRSNSSN